MCFFCVFFVFRAFFFETLCPKFVFEVRSSRRCGDRSSRAVAHPNGGRCAYLAWDLRLGLRAGSPDLQGGSLTAHLTWVSVALGPLGQDSIFVNGEMKSSSCKQ